MRLESSFCGPQVGSDVVERTNMRMIQRCDGLRFSLKTLAEGVVAGFDGDSSIEASVSSLPHLPHPAFAEGTENLIRA